MDNFNFRNMQLAYQAVHDVALCESMDKLGFFDNQEQLKVSQRRNQRTDSNVQREEYEIYELVLEHLLDEGYVDTVEGALSILENMSDEWIDQILLEKEGYGDAAIDRDPLSRFRPDKEALEYLKKHPYVATRFIRGDRGGPELNPKFKNFYHKYGGKIAGGSNDDTPKPKRVIPSRLDKNKKK